MRASMPRISLKKGLTWFGGVIASGIWVSIIAGKLLSDWVYLLPIIIGISGILVIVSLLFILFDRQEMQVKLLTPTIVRDEELAKRNARKGYICFAVLPNSPKELSSVERLEAARRLDFDSLKLDDPSSNWAPTIYGITTHVSKLEHCWLIGTYIPGVPDSGSSAYMPVLVEYLRQRKGLVNCNFHYGKDYIVPIETDDALVWKQAYDCVFRILLTDAPDLRLKPKDIIADITTGPRSMILGMILSCLDKDRDIQMVGTHYDKAGLPDNRLFTAIYPFEPHNKE